MSFTRLEMALMVYVLAVLLILFNGAKADESEFVMILYLHILVINQCTTGQSD